MAGSGVDEPATSRHLADTGFCDAAAGAPLARSASSRSSAKSPTVARLQLETSTPAASLSRRTTASFSSARKRKSYSAATPGGLPNRQICAIPTTGGGRPEPPDSPQSASAPARRKATLRSRWPNLVPTHDRGRRPPRGRSARLLLPPKLSGAAPPNRASRATIAFLESDPGAPRLAMPMATVRSFPAVAGQARRRTTGSSPRRSPAPHGRENECDPGASREDAMLRLAECLQLPRVRLTRSASPSSICSPKSFARGAWHGRGPASSSW